MIAPEHRDKWSSREESALAVLRQGYTSSQRPVSPSQRLFFILIFPARVECAESWTVFRDTNAVTRQQRYYVSYLRWRRDIDHEMFENPAEIPVGTKPAVEYKEIVLQDRFVEGLLERFKCASVQALAMPKYYLQDAPIDGTMHEVVLGGVFTSSRFRWYTWPQSGDPLPEWKSLGKAVRETLADLRRATSDKRSRAP